MHLHMGLMEYYLLVAMTVLVLVVVVGLLRIKLVGVMVKGIWGMRLATIMMVEDVRGTKLMVII